MKKGQKVATPSQRSKARANLEKSRAVRKVILARTAAGVAEMNDRAAGADTSDIDHLPVIATLDGSPLRRGLRGRIKDNGAVEIEDDREEVDEDALDTRPPIAPPVMFELEVSMSLYAAAHRASRRHGGVGSVEATIEVAVNAVLDVLEPASKAVAEQNIRDDAADLSAAPAPVIAETSTAIEPTAPQNIRAPISPGIPAAAPEVTLVAAPESGETSIDIERTEPKIIPGPDNLQAMVDAHVIRVFNESGRNVSETARRLGIERSTVKRQYMFRLGLVAAEVNRGPVKRIEVIPSLVDAKVFRVPVRRRCSGCGELGCRIDRCPRTGRAVPSLAAPSLAP